MNLDTALMTNAEIHHHYTVLQLAADAANNDVMNILESGDHGHNGYRLMNAQVTRDLCESAAERWHADNRDAIRMYLKGFEDLASD
jgi:hypothetical protein